MSIDLNTLDDKQLLDIYCQANILTTPEYARIEPLAVTKQLPSAHNLLRNKINQSKFACTDLIGSELDCYNKHRYQVICAEREVPNSNIDKFVVKKVSRNSYTRGGGLKLVINERALSDTYTYNIIYSNKNDNYNTVIENRDEDQNYVIIWGDSSETTFYLITNDGKEKTTKLIRNTDGFTIGDDKGYTLDCYTDEHGKLIRTERDSEIHLYHYDEHNRIIKLEEYDGRTLKFTREFEYDQLGNIILEKKYGIADFRNVDIMIEFAYEHDENGIITDFSKNILKK